MKPASAAFDHLLEEMAATLGVVSDTREDKMRQIATMIGVPPIDTGNVDQGIIELYHAYLRYRKRNHRVG